MLNQFRLKLAGCYFIVILMCGWLTPLTSDIRASESMGTFEQVVEGLDFPSNLVVPQDGSGRIFVMEKNKAQVLIVQDGKISPDIFLDISDRIVSEKNRNPEQGLLDLAFPPGFPEKSHVYLTYTDKNADLVLSRFQISKDRRKAIESSEEILLVAENFVIVSWTKGYHHCGDMEFSPKDKYLYICVGDSDNQGNPRQTAQPLNFVQGKLLRLDVESGVKPYAIPADNPFVKKEGARPEIWANGLRNPWGFSFDPLTGDLYITDVGWEFFEEINFQPASSKGGENYGWNFAEGNYCQKICDDKDFVWPVHEYTHGENGCAVIGGVVYRGKKFPDWNGVYLFSDYCAGKIWALRDIKENPKLRLISEEPMSTTSIRADGNGEILIANSGEGKLLRFNFPEKFDVNWRLVSDVKYELMVEFWRTNRDVNRKIES